MGDQLLQRKQTPVGKPRLIKKLDDERLELLSFHGQISDIFDTGLLDGFSEAILVGSTLGNLKKSTGKHTALSRTTSYKPSLPRKEAELQAVYDVSVKKRGPQKNVISLLDLFGLCSPRAIAGVELEGRMRLESCKVVLKWKKHVAAHRFIF